MGRTKQGKKLPPEAEYDSPEEYYKDDILDGYTHGKSLMRIQERITKRALEIIQAEQPCLILDIGMGCGFSTSYLYLMGYDVVGIDLLFGMLDEYEIPELNPINSDMKLLPFRDNSFDYIMSISAFQWIIDKYDTNIRAEILKSVAKSFNRILKPKGKIVIQFYPLHQEMIKEIGTIFSDVGGFTGNFIIDNPDSSVKRKLYLYLEKK